MGRRDRQVELKQLDRTEFPRLVRSLALVYGAESAADGVQEAFPAAHRS